MWLWWVGGHPVAAPSQCGFTVGVGECHTCLGRVIREKPVWNQCNKSRKGEAEGLLARSAGLQGVPTGPNGWTAEESRSHITLGKACQATELSKDQRDSLGLEISTSCCFNHGVKISGASMPSA